MSDLPPSPAEFKAALRRVAAGMSTADDADVISRYVLDLEEACQSWVREAREAREMLMRERASSDRLQRALDEAFNSGSGAYIP